MKVVSDNIWYSNAIITQSISERMSASSWHIIFLRFSQLKYFVLSSGIYQVSREKTISGIIAMFNASKSVAKSLINNSTKFHVNDVQK